MERFSRNLLLLQNARIREKEDVSIQVEDVAWQVDRTVALQRGEWPRRKTSRCRIGTQGKGDKKERDDSVRFFISPLSSSPPFVPINSPNDDNFFCY